MTVSSKGRRVGDSMPFQWGRRECEIREVWDFGLSDVDYGCYERFGRG